LGKMFEPPASKAKRQAGVVGKDGEKTAENVAG